MLTYLTIRTIALSVVLPINRVYPTRSLGSEDFAREIGVEYISGRQAPKSIGTRAT